MAAIGAIGIFVCDIASHLAHFHFLTCGWGWVPFPDIPQAYIMTGGGPNNATLFLTQIVGSTAKHPQENQFGYASALVWILFVIIGLFTMLVLVRAKIGCIMEGQEKMTMRKAK